MVVRPKRFNSGPAMARLSSRMEQLVELYGQELICSWLIAYDSELLIDSDFDLMLNRHMFNLIASFKLDHIIKWFEMIHERRVI